MNKSKPKHASDKEVGKLKYGYKPKHSKKMIVRWLVCYKDQYVTPPQQKKTSD